MMECKTLQGEALELFRDDTVRPIIPTSIIGITGNTIRAWPWGYDQ